MKTQSTQLDVADGHPLQLPDSADVRAMRQSSAAIESLALVLLQEDPKVARFARSGAKSLVGLSKALESAANGDSNTSIQLKELTGGSKIEDFAIYLKDNAKKFDTILLERNKDENALKEAASIVGKILTNNYENTLILSMERDQIMAKLEALVERSGSPVLKQFVAVRSQDSSSTESMIRELKSLDKAVLTDPPLSKFKLNEIKSQFTETAPVENSSVLPEGRPALKPAGEIPTVVPHVLITPPPDGAAVLEGLLANKAEVVIASPIPPVADSGDKSIVKVLTAEDVIDAPIRNGKPHNPKAPTDLDATSKHVENIEVSKESVARSAEPTVAKSLAELVEQDKSIGKMVAESNQHFDLGNNPEEEALKKAIIARIPASLRVKDEKDHELLARVIEAVQTSTDGVPQVSPEFINAAQKIKIDREKATAEATPAKNKLPPSGADAAVVTKKGGWMDFIKKASIDLGGISSSVVAAVYLTHLGLLFGSGTGAALLAVPMTIFTVGVTAGTLTAVAGTLAIPAAIGYAAYKLRDSRKNRLARQKVEANPHSTQIA